MGGERAEILYHGPNQINLRMPLDAPPSADIYISVDGCFGNGFEVKTVERR